MKRLKTLIFITALASLSTVISAQASEKGDTLIIENAKKVTVINGDSILKVDIDGITDDSTYHYSAMIQAVDSNFVSKETLGKDFDFHIGPFGKSKTNCQKNSVVMHFLIGFNRAADGPSGLSTNYGKSFEIGFWFEHIYRPWLNGHHFSAGVGLEWRNYRMTNRNEFVKAPNGNTSVQPLNPNADPDFSRVKLLNFIFPIQYGYGHKGWGFAVGPVINLNTRASILTKYTLDGEMHKEKYKNIHPTKLSVDFMGTIVTPWLDFFIKYNPCNVLDSEFAPKFQSLSFGILF